MEAFDNLFEKYLHATGVQQTQAANDIAMLVESVPLLCEMLKGENRRAALALLSRCVKKQQHRQAFMALDESLLVPLLKDSDAKTRKNTAVLIGSLQSEAYVPALIEALQQETQQFVLPSVILALGAIGGSAAREALAKLPAIEGDDKHAREQRDALSKAQSRVDPRKQRTFTSFPKPMEVWLAPVSGLDQVLMQEGTDKGFLLEPRDGYLANKTADYASLFKMRCFYEALLPIAAQVSTEAKAFAAVFKKLELFDLLSSMHDGSGPFGLRLELRMNATNRGEFASEFFGHLPQTQFINAPSSYDVELRAVEKDGKATLMLRLYGFEDTRFSYRTEAVSASIHPAAAAAILYAHREFMLPSHDVLDPFCGAGTLLAERAKIMGAKTLTGLDSSAAAWRIARTNLSQAGLHAKVFNRDCRGFVREEKVHEIICNLPFGHRVGSHDENRKLYEDILKQWPSLLHKDGFVLAITNDKLLFEGMVKRHGFYITRRTPFAYGGLSPTCYMLRR